MKWLDFITAKIDTVPVLLASPYGGSFAALAVLVCLAVAGSFVWFLRRRRKPSTPQPNQENPQFNQGKEADMFTFSKNNYHHSPDPRTDPRGQKVPASIIKTLSKIPHHPLPLYPVADRHNIMPQPDVVPASVIDTENPADYGIAAELEGQESNQGQSNQGQSNQGQQEQMDSPPDSKRADFEPIPPIMSPPITPQAAPTLFSKDPSMPAAAQPFNNGALNNGAFNDAVPHPASNEAAAYPPSHLTPMGKINPS